MFKHPLAREITALLAFKAAALVALYLLFFAPSDRADALRSGHPVVGPAQMSAAESSVR